MRTMAETWHKRNRQRKNSLISKKVRLLSPNESKERCAVEQLIIPAEAKRLDEVLSFVDAVLNTYDCPADTQVLIDIAVEEIYVNIANYAYHPEIGCATITCRVESEPLKVIIEFSDEGIKYNPLEREDPNLELAADEREIGGLGIYMVKTSMDNVSYRYENGNNIFTIEKKLK